MVKHTDYKNLQGNGSSSTAHRKLKIREALLAMPCSQTIRVSTISDNQNSLKAGPRGPVLLEDFVLREKIFHFDHERIPERIPERIVHARGSGAHGYFEVIDPLTDVKTMSIFQKKGKKTPVFDRMSTVAGGAGSVDTPRDVRGFAIKFMQKMVIEILWGTTFRFSSSRTPSSSRICFTL